MSQGFISPGDPGAEGRYRNPLGARYASEEMQRIFSDGMKFSTWRRLWVALAESEMELGIGISPEQIAEMKDHVDDIDFALAREREREVRHDVMAHVLTFGEQCPAARPIIHLGATSSFVGDNTDIIQMKMGLLRIRQLLVNAIAAGAEFAREHKDLPCLAYTHFQPAQPTTVGKRATLWLQDLLLDLAQLDFQLQGLKLLGCKGATGTGASFLKLFAGDHERVQRLERMIAEKMGFDAVFPVSGQTYPRKLDFQVLSVLSGIAQSAAKFSNDIRLLSHLKEVDEPFETGQIGSSAMAYKRNPMRSERIAALARYVMLDAVNPAITAAGQWFERTLDDSANRRISIPEAFLGTDAILSLYINIIRGLTVYPTIIEKHLREELPFIATENILMYSVQKGGDRQRLHEAIRRHAVKAAEQIKVHGQENDLAERILNDPEFGLEAGELARLMRADNFTGRAAQQAEEYLALYVRPVLEENSDLLGLPTDIRV
ncbi:MAG: adenylosuccinate lyase [Syntrophomonadaceae bacterium]|nr:adenylosuccinate lyase [Syntrophomonadaceae bacterium]